MNLVTLLFSIHRKEGYHSRNHKKNPTCDIFVVACTRGFGIFVFLVFLRDSDVFFVILNRNDFAFFDSNSTFANYITRITFCRSCRFFFSYKSRVAGMIVSCFFTIRLITFGAAAS